MGRGGLRLAWLIWIGAFPLSLSAQSLVQTWNWSDPACVTVDTPPMILSWTWDFTPTPQTLVYKTATIDTTVQWSISSYSTLTGAKTGYTLWLQPPGLPPMDLLAMEPSNLGYGHAELIATVAGQWCGQARAIGVYQAPGTVTLRPPSKPILKGL